MSVNLGKLMMYFENNFCLQLIRLWRRCKKHTTRIQKDPRRNQKLRRRNTWSTNAQHSRVLATFMTINNQASSQQRQLYAKPPVPAPRKIQAQKLAANKIDEFFARRIKKPSWRVSYDQHCCRRGRNCATSQELCADIEYKGIKKQSLTSITVNCTTKADAAKKGGDIIKKICMEINIVVAKPLVKWRHHRTGSKIFHWYSRYNWRILTPTETLLFGIVLTLIATHAMQIGSSSWYQSNLLLLRRWTGKYARIWICEIHTVNQILR